MNRAWRVTGLVACLLLIAGVSSAFATDTIFACVNKTSGNIRVVTSPADCASNEVSLSWNIMGPQGPKGDPGPVGPRGPSFGDGLFANIGVTVPGCDWAELLSYPVTLTEPSRIFAAAKVHFFRQTTPGPDGAGISVELLDASKAIVAFAPRIDVLGVGEDQLASLTLAGGLISAANFDPAGSTVYTAPAGNYTLRLVGQNWGLCSSASGKYYSPALSHIVIGAKQ